MVRFSQRKEIFGWEMSKVTVRSYIWKSSSKGESERSVTGKDKSFTPFDVFV